MTQMKDIAWPQPTWDMVSVGSPFGSTTVKNEKGGVETIALNRATRRRYAAINSTRLERLVDQEERADKVRQQIRK